MRALLIDPLKGETTEVDYDQSLPGMYRLIGGGCNCVEIHRSPLLKGKDGLYVDEEGHMHPAYLGPDKSGLAVGRFNIKGRSEWFVGRGLVLGHTQDGDECEPQTTLKQLKKMVTYVRGQK